MESALPPNLSRFQGGGESGGVALHPEKSSSPWGGRFLPRQEPGGAEGTGAITLKQRRGFLRLPPLW